MNHLNLEVAILVCCGEMYSILIVHQLSEQLRQIGAKTITDGQCLLDDDFKWWWPLWMATQVIEQPGRMIAVIPSQLSKWR